MQEATSEKGSTIVSAVVARGQAIVRMLLARADVWFNRLYTWKYNPLYQSGTIVVLTLAIMLATGLYLVIFYRIGSPYESVVRISEQAFTGRWMRSLHRYAADVAIVAAAVHALRMFAQGRSWGPRTLAWLSGLFLVFLMYVCGWTGYVMVWDIQGQMLAVEGARILDALPIFAVPVGRAFVGETVMPGAFFFLNLFLHIAVPIGLALLLWMHVARIQRPVLLPPRGLLWGTTAILLVFSIVWPAPMDAPADLLQLPGHVSVDWFYSFWLPFSRALAPWTAWIVVGGASALLLLAPWWTRPRPEARVPTSVVKERFCTECNQCYVDCPYDAIRMVKRSDGRPYLVAKVDPSLCVACGICAGSCAPMGVGPPERTGRDQLQRVEAFIATRDWKSSDIVLVACERGARIAASGTEHDGLPVYPVPCAGNVHSSVIEYLIRSGVGGVLVAACPPRDCWNREGPRWLNERLFADRPAELKPRVDARRVCVAYAAEAEEDVLAAALRDYREYVGTLEASASESDIELDLECDLPEVGAPDGVTT